LRDFLTLLGAFLILLTYSDLNAQQYSYRSYSTEDSINPLPASSVYDIIQDHEGFIWFSAIGGGLNKYDGRSFQTIRNHTDAIPDMDYIVGIFQTPDRYLWLKTTGGLLISTEPLYESGLNSMPVFTDSLSKGDAYFKLYKGNTLAYSDDAFAFDPHTGGMWVATGSAGIIHYKKNDSNSWRADTLLPARFFPEHGAAINDVYSVIVRENNELVFVTRGGYIGVLNLEERGKLFRNELETFNFRRFDSPELLGVHISLFEDSQKRIWGGTTLGKVWRFDDAMFDSISTIHFLPDYSENVELAMIFRIAEDSKQNIWIGSSTGASFFNPDKGKSFQFIKQSETIGVNTIFIDHENNVWIGSHNGIKKFRANFESIKLLDHQQFSFSVGKEVQAVAGVNERVWFGTSTGLLEVKKQDVGYVYAFFGTTETGMEPYIYSIEHHPNGSVWIGKNNGFTIISDANNPKIYNLSGLRSIFNKKVNQDYHVQSFSLSHSVGEISHILVDDKVVTFLVDNSSMSVFIENQIIDLGRILNHPRPGINSIVAAPDGHLWVSTVFEGLLRSVLPLSEII